MIWLLNKRITSQHFEDNNLFNWLLTTSGYYDKQINASFFNLNKEELNKVIESETYNKYMEAIFNGMKNCDYLYICLHTAPFYDKYIEDIKTEMNPSRWQIAESKDMFSLMENKRVLVISCYASLMEEQVKSGNCSSIYPDFPKNTTIIPYDSIYTFFNNGPDNNILETCERYKKEISNIEFDVGIVSCGAYTHLLVPYISDTLGKDAFTSNACIIADSFGIITKRHGLSPEYQNTAKYWINVPEKYKPEGYEKIEGGCYW
jgi:hypothetical protein